MHLLLVFMAPRAASQQGDLGFSGRWGSITQDFITYTVDFPGLNATTKAHTFLAFYKLQSVKHHSDTKVSPLRNENLKKA